MTATLNYVAQALKGLQENLKVYTEADPISAANKQVTKHAIALLRRAQHFQIGDDGRILNDNLRGLTPEALRLPYDVTSISYFCGFNKDDPKNTGLFPVCKRISLAFEVTAETASDTLAHAQGNSTALKTILQALNIMRKNIGDTPIGIISICEYPLQEKATWVVYPFMGLIGQNMPLKSYQQVELIPGVRKNFEDHLREEQAAGMSNFKTVFDVINTDLASEMSAVLELCEALSCSNVSHEVLSRVTPAMNAKRVRKGKLPLVEMRVLVVKTPGSRGEKTNMGGTHASPKEHLRRGHIRRLPKGNIWINSAVVNAGVSGKIKKSYVVKA